MDYGKSGAPKSAKGAPKFNPHKTLPKGTAEPDAKAALVARMKAAAEKKKTK
ncbi:hypothetical protein [Marivita sp.]|jgi:hypothetical protein|uniref:hypothetical protein n=1 Tax=Marivita sp. TaxID=2003365 RepID=UPI0032190161